MPDFCEKAESISCCVAESVGTGLLEGVGAGATKARLISSVVAFRMNISSFTIHRVPFPGDTAMNTREKALYESRDLPSTSLNTPLTVNDNSVLV